MYCYKQRLLHELLIHHEWFIRAVLIIVYRFACVFNSITDHILGLMTVLLNVLIRLYELTEISGSLLVTLATIIF